MREALEQVIREAGPQGVTIYANCRCDRCTKHTTAVADAVAGYVDRWLRDHRHRGASNLPWMWRHEHGVRDTGAGDHSGGGAGDLRGGQAAPDHEAARLGGTGAEERADGAGGDGAEPEPARQVLIDTTVDGTHLEVERRRVGEEYGWGAWDHEWRIAVSKDGQSLGDVGGLSTKAMLRLIDLLSTIQGQPG